jgi:hypothetical protein
VARALKTYTVAAYAGARLQPPDFKCEVTMSLREVVATEVRVATSRNAQPLWFRIVKWAAILSAVVYFRGAPYFWWWVIALVSLAIALHLLWRTKTKRWTQPWGGWNDVAATRPVTKK